MPARPLDPDLLESYLAVLEAGRISTAARGLNLSQPAVTARMRKLEEDLGTPLLLRSVRGVAPTPAGERLRSYALRIRSLLREASDAVAGAGRDVGKLSLMASTTIAAHVLPGPLAAFHSRYPEARLQLEIGNTGEVIDAVREGAFPLGLVEGHRRASGVRLEPWVDDELVLVTRPGQRFRPRSLAELQDLPLLWREPGSGTRAVMSRALKQAGLRHRPGAEDLVLASSEAIAGAAAAGLGLAFLSRWSVKPYLSAGRLKLVAGLGDLQLRRTFHWALPTGGLSGAAALFLDQARAHPPQLSS